MHMIVTCLKVSQTIDYGKFSNSACTTSPYYENKVLFRKQFNLDCFNSKKTNCWFK